MELHGSPKTKELKKKQSSIPVGEVEMGNQEERTQGKVAAGGQGKAAAGGVGSPTYACR